MKTKLFMAAAIAACFGLMTAVTSCEGTDPENTDQTEQGGEQGGPTTDPDDEGGEPVAEVSIYKQWVCTYQDQGTDAKRCYDITETTIIIGDWADGYETLLENMGITVADPDKSYYAMSMGPDTIKEVTATDETSGTITYTTIDMYTQQESEVSIEYSKLTSTTVDITQEVLDPMAGTTTKVTYNCTAATEPVKVYSYADIPTTEE